MNNTKVPVSLEDTSNLRKLILENPDLPLVIFAYTDDICNNYGSVMVEANGGYIEELTLYTDKWGDARYLDRVDYRDMLIGDLCDEEWTNDLTDEKFYEVVDKKIAETEFVKAIVVHVG